MTFARGGESLSSDKQRAPRARALQLGDVAVRCDHGGMASAGHIEMTGARTVCVRVCVCACVCVCERERDKRDQVMWELGD